mmetsp:Transcript_22278/g.39975  ORF Transcript_22278/g.39975 Transcript_22278/m.39975 type:complete len:113 (+) Transcript_22278:1942-2280(+)
MGLNILSASQLTISWPICHLVCWGPTAAAGSSSACYPFLHAILLRPTHPPSHTGDLTAGTGSLSTCYAFLHALPFPPFLPDSTNNNVNNIYDSKQKLHASMHAHTHTHAHTP